MKQQKIGEKKKPSSYPQAFMESPYSSDEFSAERSISIEAAKAELHPSAPEPHFMYTASSHGSQWEV